MASIWTEDPQSLASELESDAVTTLSREDAVHAVASKIWTKTPVADWASSTRQKCVFESLPVKDQMFEDLRGNINHLIDRIEDWEGEFDENRLVSLMQQGMLAELPEIFRPMSAIEIPYQMNLCVLPKGGAKFDIFKHFMFERCTMKLGDALPMVRGQPYLVDFQGNRRAGVKPFIYMFQRLGGLQISSVRVLLRPHALHLCELQTQQLQVKKEQNDRFYEMNRRLSVEPPILVESPNPDLKRKARSSSASSQSSF